RAIARFLVGVAENCILFTIVEEVIHDFQKQLIAVLVGEFDDVAIFLLHFFLVHWNRLPFGVSYSSESRFMLLSRSVYIIAYCCAKCKRKAKKITKETVRIA